MFIHLVKYMRIIQQLRISSGKINRPHEKPEAFKKKRLAATAIAFTILTYFIIHCIKRPRT